MAQAEPRRTGGARTRTRRRRRAVALAVTALAAGAMAIGPRPALAQASTGGAGNLWLAGSEARPALRVGSRIETSIVGVVARTRVLQRFRNPEDTWLDAVYAFPLPEGAAVDTLRVRAGERLIEGEIMERSAARRTFERARDEGRRAALLDQQRANWFRTAISAIEPLGEVEVVIEYQELLDLESDGVHWRLPLAAPHRPGGYGPEEPAPEEPAEEIGANDAADAIIDGTPPVGRTAATGVEVSIEIEAGFPLASAHSPSHAPQLQHEALDVDRARFSGALTGDRDLVLRWRWRTGSEPELIVLSEPLPDGPEDAVLMMFLPSAPEGARRIDRELVLVVDTSGSMAGAPIRHARRALRSAIERLGPNDRFNVIAFAAEPRPLFERSRRATAETLAAAIAFIEALRAEGGTDADAALAVALADPNGSASAVRQVVFVSDGGVAGEPELLRRLSEELGRSRLHAVAIGSAPNGHFLRSAARLGRGTVTFIAARDEVGERMKQLFEKLEAPTVADLAVEWPDGAEMWPPRLPDLHAGAPLVAAALVPRAQGEVRVRGRAADRPVEWSLPLEPTRPAAGIARLFARRKIRALEDGLARGDDPESVGAAVLATALRHRIVSSRTSLVAVERTPRRPRSAPGRSASGRAADAAADDAVIGPVGTLPAGATPAALWWRTGLALWAGGTGLALGVRRIRRRVGRPC